MSLLRLDVAESEANKQYEYIYQKATYPLVCYNNQSITIESFIPHDIKCWLERIESFTNDYLDYRFDKIDEDEKKESYLAKIIKGIPNEKERWVYWFNDTFQRFNKFRKKSNLSQWRDYDLLYNPMGEYRLYTFMIAFRMQLNNKNNK